MEPFEKEQVVQLVDRWLERSHLSLKQVLARVQAQGCDVSKDYFDNRFRRFDVRPDIPPDLTLAIIAAFTTGLAPSECCTPAEAIELARLTHLPIDRFNDMGEFFPDQAFAEVLGRYMPTSVGPDKTAATTTPNLMLTPPLHLPGKSYHRLVGRTRELEQLLELLREPERKPIVAVIGLGGIGKTTLVQEAMDRCWQEGLFDHIVWTSAKTERFVGEGTHKIEISDFSFERLLDEIGRQCDRRELPKMPPAEKEAAVKHLLQAKRALIVVDNLETVPNSEAFVEAICQILGQSKLLITSRHHIRHERAYTLDLSGLFEADGIAFLREDSAERGIDLVAQASQADLVEIYRASGGAPLAMKLVIGQVSRWPLERVLDNLKAARYAGPNYDFYQFIFKHSWDLLTLEAKQTLVSMAVFDLANGCTEAALAPVCKLSPDMLQLALDHLILLSLVETFGNLTTRRYTLHSLTHYFILSDIVKKWS
ncbi:MAG: AAA family ATPase [Anaerolineae bacterium]|nr:AAA family ATPase [Anaerolineae bacterium]